MGCGGSKAAADGGGGGGGGGSRRDLDQDLRSKQLEEELERQHQEEAKEVKLLVLGTGESGKSTVFKQMKILYSVPDPPSKFVMICRANLFANATAVIDGMQRLQIDFKSEAAKAASETIKAVPADGNPDHIETLVAPLKTLFQDGGVQEAIERAAEFQLNDSTVYFWQRCEDLCKHDYLPSAQDVLRARVRTTGIVQQHFQIKDKKYTMFDVGGQRNERRKWIHCFDNVTAVIFVTAISEYDQVLYEDENTNRMDEALTLFEQICNHPSFKKTSMILFLNKRDLFEAKLKKKPMTCWRDVPELKTQDYDRCLSYIKECYVKLNREQETRQVYVHATCATDTDNISFVMESVFDIILKENLRKLAVGDVESMLELASGSGVSGVATGPSIWAPDRQGKIILAASFFTENLGDRSVLVSADNVATQPAVQVGLGLSIAAADWAWIMGLGKKLPQMPVLEAEAGSFRGDFKKAAQQLRDLLGVDELGSVYDNPVVMTAANGARTTIIPVVRKFDTQQDFPACKWVVHEEFENACYKAFDNKNTDEHPCEPPPKNQEFDPFAANPVHHRWFKGITLFTKEALKAPTKGVYLGIFKVLSASGGFKIMVNEHNRISIPMIFLSENQLSAQEVQWMHGVRTREERFGIDLLEGAKPNRGWLGPEMSGEEGATFKEKLWWAIDEAKARLNTDNIGKQYDKELLFIDENNKIQLLLYGVLAKDASDCLPGHIWVDQPAFLVENMKYFCPTVLDGMVNEVQGKIDQVLKSGASGNGSQTMHEVDEMRKSKKQAVETLKALLSSQTPLKWVDRVIIWCAEKMPSFCEGVAGSSADECVANAKAKTPEIAKAAADRDALIEKYKK